MGPDGGGSVGRDRVRGRPGGASPACRVAIAAVGCALAVFGLFLISGDAQAGDGDGDGSNVPGIVLSAARRAGRLRADAPACADAPAASAGVTAVILGLPGLALFLTIDVDDVPPFSIEAAPRPPHARVGRLRTSSAQVGAGRSCSASPSCSPGCSVLQVVEDPFASGDIDDVVEPGVFDDELGDPGFDEEAPSDGDAFLGGTSEPDATTIGWICGAVRGRLPRCSARRFDKRQLARQRPRRSSSPATPRSSPASSCSPTISRRAASASPVVLIGIVVARFRRRRAGGGSRRSSARSRSGSAPAIVLGDSMEDASRHRLRHRPVRRSARRSPCSATVFHGLDGRAAADDPRRHRSFPRWSQGRLRRRHHAGRAVRRDRRRAGRDRRCAGSPWTASAPPAGGRAVTVRLQRRPRGADVLPDRAPPRAGPRPTSRPPPTCAPSPDGADRLRARPTSDRPQPCSAGRSRPNWLGQVREALEALSPGP